MRSRIVFPYESRRSPVSGWMRAIRSSSRRRRTGRDRSRKSCCRSWMRCARSSVWRRRRWRRSRRCIACACDRRIRGRITKRGTCVRGGYWSSRVAPVAVVGSRRRASQSMGGANCAAPGQADPRCGPGASHRRDPVRDVARRTRVQSSDQSGAGGTAVARDLTRDRRA